MSHVTDIVLITFIDDNAFTLEFGLTQVEEHAGGNKHMQCNIFMAAINYLDIEKMISWFKNTKWEYPKCAQLLYKDEYDDRFTLIHYKERIK